MAHSLSGIVYSSEGQQGLAHLLLQQVVVNAWIVDVSARVTLTQTFFNEFDRSTGRAKYVFPIPAYAAVCAFEMEYQDGRIITGKIKERSEDFEAVAHEGRQAGLVEWVTGDLFTISLGSIPARTTLVTKLTFVMDLMDDEVRDQVRLQLPMTIAQRYGQTPTAGSDAEMACSPTKVYIKVDIQTSGEIQKIASPSHPSISILRYSSHSGRKSLRRKSAILSLSTFLEDNFVLIVHAEGLNGPRCFAELDARESDTIAMQLTLIPKFQIPRIRSQEYIFVVDRSGSMDGLRIETAKNTLAMLLRMLPGSATVLNIFSFGSHVSSLWPNSVPYSDGTLVEAITHISSMAANYGGTEIALALQHTLDLRKINVPTVVFVLTDGESSDVDNTTAIVKNAVDASSVDAPLRVFTLGIGDTVSIAMCEAIARAGNGEFLLAFSPESIVGKCARLMRAGQSSVIEEITIDWGLSPNPPTVSFSRNQRHHTNQQVELRPPPRVQQSPPRIVNIYPGSRLIVFAIVINRDIPTEITLHARLKSGDEYTLTVPVMKVQPFAHQASPLPLVHVLAARQLINDLLLYKAPLPSAIGVASDSDILKAAVVRLGETYQLVGRYTSFVAVDRRDEMWRHTDHRTAWGSFRSRRDRSPKTLPVTYKVSGSSVVDGLIQGIVGLTTAIFGIIRYVDVPTTSGRTSRTTERSYRASDWNRKGIDFESTDTFSTLSSLEGSSGSSHWTSSRTPSPPADGDPITRSASPNIQQLPYEPGNLPLPAFAPQPISESIFQLVQLQAFDGSFPLQSIVGQFVSEEAASKAEGFNADKTVWATALVVAYLKEHLDAYPDLLDCILDKVLEFIETTAPQLQPGIDVDAFDGLVVCARRMMI